MPKNNIRTMAEETKSVAAALNAAVNGAEEPQVINVFAAFDGGEEFDAEARATKVVDAGLGIKVAVVVQRLVFRTNDEGTEFVGIVCNKRAVPTISDGEIAATNTIWQFKSQIIAAICRADSVLAALIDSENLQHLSLALSGAKLEVLAEYIAAGETSIFADSEYTFDSDTIRCHILDVELNQSIVKMLTEKLIAKL